MRSVRIVELQARMSSLGHPGCEMVRQIHGADVLYVVAMAAIIVGVDFVFFRSRFWERLMVNIGIVLVFAAFYLRFFKCPWSPGD